MKGDFPEGFLWGVSTAAHQIEGEDKDSDWWEWEEAGKVGNKVRSRRACDSYKKWKTDNGWIENLGLNAYRFSLSWARIEPKRGKWNQEVVLHYKRLLKDLRRRGIKRMVTLHHFVNPAWFLELGAWEKSENIVYYESFVAKVVGELGELVDYWITINEPMTVVGFGYLLGNHVPCKRDLWLAIKVRDNLIEAHKAAYRKLHELYNNPQVGIVEQMIKFEPVDYGSRWQVCAANWLHQEHNRRFLDKVSRDDVDFIGVNYFTRVKIKWDNRWIWNILSRRGSWMYPQTAKWSSEVMGWEVYPEGLRWAVKQVSRYGKPIYVTENGFDHSDDQLRKKFIIEHLRNLQLAIEQGVDVKGYFYWSLLDNFEWDWGYGPRFGLLSVGSDGFRRKAKKSAWLMKQIAWANRLPL